jgi:hypothetical protein
MPAPWGRLIRSEQEKGESFPVTTGPLERLLKKNYIILNGYDYDGKRKVRQAGGGALLSRPIFM